MLFGAGATAAVLGSLLSGSLLGGRLPAPGPIAAWAADRGGDRVYGLDDGWIVVRAIDVGSPLRVQSAGAHGVWIVRARAAHAQAAQCLALWSDEGTQLLELEIGRCIDLAATQGGDALCVEQGRDGPDRAWSIAHDGVRRMLLEASGLTSIASLGTSIAIGTASGELVRIEIDGSTRSCALVGFSVADIAAGPEPDSVWVLDSRRRVVLVDARDQVSWSADAGFEASALTPIPGEERVWVAANDEPRARRFGRGGELELDCSGFAATGVESALGLADGGVLLALPGAILLRDRGGRPAPGQGGFHTLVDLAPR